MQNAVFFRIAMYFTYYTVLLIPEVISAFDDREESIINLILIALLIVLFLIAGPGSGVDNYYFFWQKNIPSPVYLKL